jgi:hypothetical protein
LCEPLFNARQTGLDKQQAVQEKLALLACYREGINAHLTAAIAMAEERPGGLSPKVEILLRADSHYAGPQVFDWCRANRVDWVFGLAPNGTLCRHVAGLEKTTAERFRAAPAHGKRRRFVQFYDAAQSWSPVERVIARVEAGPEGSDTPFIVTKSFGRPRQALVRGGLLRAVRPRTTSKPGRTTSPPTAPPATRPKLTSFACSRCAASWPKRSIWRVMQFDTLRLRLVKLAARVIELKTQIKIHLPSSAPEQAIFATLLDRLPRLVT